MDRKSRFTVIGILLIVLGLLGALCLVLRYLGAPWWGVLMFVLVFGELYTIRKKLESS